MFVFANVSILLNLFSYFYNYMENFQIQTAQNVTIKQNLAGIGQRLAAFLLDMLFLSLFYYFIFYLLGKTGMLDRFKTWTFISVLMLPYFLYYPIMQYFNNGQTFGKQLVKIRVVKIDNSHPRLGDFLIRWVIRLFEISMIPGLGLLVILLNDKNQRLGDIAARTTVVSEQKKAKLDHSIFEDIDTAYQPGFAQAAYLSEKDAQLIKKVFVEAKKIGDRAILSELSKKIENILQIQRPKGMRYHIFIDTVLKDYNYFASNQS